MHLKSITIKRMDQNQAIKTPALTSRVIINQSDNILVHFTFIKNISWGRYDTDEEDNCTDESIKFAKVHQTAAHLGGRYFLLCCSVCSLASEKMKRRKNTKQNNRWFDRQRAGWRGEGARKRFFPSNRVQTPRGQRNPGGVKIIVIRSQRLDRGRT